ncbi:MAG: PAS domain S-box protein, partial [Burkholderiales bacterium]
MSGVTAVWSMLAAACLTLAFTHAVIGTKQPLLRSHLLFAGAALAVAAIAAFELMLMQSHSVEQYSRLQRWAHVPVFVMFVCAVFFVRAYLRAGRLWLAYLVCGVRLVGLIVNFTSGASLNFQEISTLEQMSFLGDAITLARGTLNPWGWLGPLASLVFVVYIGDASREAWRSSSPAARRRAVAVGGSIAFFIAAATIHAQLVHARIIESPYLIAAAFFSILVVMAYELGADVVRSAELARELGRNERRMQLAVEAAGIGLWEWDVTRDLIHIIHGAPALFGDNTRGFGDLETYLERIQAEDREAVRAALHQSLESGTDCRLEFRVPARDLRAPRWIASRGRVEYGLEGKPVLMRGVVYDVTQRRQAQERVRVVLDATPNGFVMTGSEGDIVMANAQAEKIFGYGRGELLGRSVDILVPEQMREAHALHRGDYLSNASARAMSIGRDVYGRRKDGGQVALEIGLTPVDMPDGRFVLAAIVDVTERQRLKRESAQRRDEIAHLSRVAVLAELSGSLAHELKQPLAAIIMNAQAAQRFIHGRPPDVAEVPHALADIVSEGKRAVELIDRLRDLFSKREAQRIPLDMNEV